MTKDILAFDKSVRRKDADGRLYVEFSPISKACVSPYLGSEIPNADAFGLTPSKIYYLLRDPVELAKAADTFRGVPILIRHEPVNVDEHPKELTVGAVGTEVVFNAPYLEAPLCIWTAEAIAGIETRTQTEISSGYRYTADMTPGEYEGAHYDGVMRNIQGNHVALVDVGRAGPDVVVQDRKPETLRATQMKTKLRLSPAGAAVNGALRAYLTPKLAQDAAIGSLGALLSGVKNAATLKQQRPAIIAGIKSLVAGKLAQDASIDDIDTALDAADDDDYAEDEDEDEEERKKREAEKAAQSKPAMDAAQVASAIDAAVKAERSANAALFQARKDVEPIVGVVALDSADAVYKFALDQMKIDVTNVHPSAFGALVKMAAEKQSATVKPTVAMDADSIGATAKQFPNLARFTNV